MKNKKSQKKMSLKKIFVKSFNKFKKGLFIFVDKFKKTSKQFKFILIMWICIILLILGLLLICSNNNKNVEKHVLIEKDINMAAAEYVKEKELYPTINQKLRLSSNILIETGNLYKESITDDSCEGYALIYYSEENEDYNITSYIKCDNYVTKGFSSK